VDRGKYTIWECGRPGGGGREPPLWYVLTRRPARAGTRSKYPYFDRMTKTRAWMTKKPAHMPGTPESMTKTHVCPPADHVNALRDYAKSHFSRKSKYPSLAWMTADHPHMTKTRSHVPGAPDHVTKTRVHVPASHAHTAAAPELVGFSRKSKYPSLERMTTDHPHMNKTRPHMSCAPAHATKTHVHMAASHVHTSAAPELW
jgi:hypothetical protein